MEMPRFPLASKILCCRCRYVSRTLPSAGQVSEGTRIQLCGRLSVEIDGVQVADALRGRQVPLLLAYLVLNRDRYVGREELIGALWPFQAPRSQDAALRTLLSRLRSALGSSALAGRDELSPGASRARVDRHRGGGHRGAASAADARARRRAQRLGARAGPAQHRRPRPVARLAGALARASPARARGRAAACAGGDRARGAEHGRDAARVRRARGPQPDRGRAIPRVRLRAADGGAGAAGQRRRGPARVRSPADAAARRARDDALGRDDRGARAPPGPRRPPCRRRRRPGRHRGVRRSSCRPSSRRAPARRWSGAGARCQSSSSCGWRPPGSRREIHRGRIVLLAGDPGIGKTRLAAELARRVHAQGACVLAGRAPQETLVAYQLFVEALRQYLLNVPIGGAPGDHARVWLRARPADPRAAPAGAGAAVAIAGRARDRPLPPVRGGGRCPELDLGAGAGPARARRPPVGRPADAPAAAPPGAGLGPGPAADSRRLPGHGGDRRELRRRACRAASASG